MRRLLAVLGVALAALLPAGPASAADFTQTDTQVTMSDGVRIAVSYFEPKGTPPPAGWPAVMLLHGLGQTRNTADFQFWTPNRIAADILAPAGYAVLTFDARAHGQSEGLFTLDGPRELQDTRELFDWLTSHGNVDRTHVGAYGASYGGGMVWLAAASGVPFAAIVPAATWTDLSEALAPQGLIRAGIVVGFSQDLPQSHYDPALSALLTDALHERNVEAIHAFQAARSTRDRLRGLSVPTFMLQGRRDFAFDARQALTAYARLAGPKRLYLGDFGHPPAPNPAAEFPYAVAEAKAWFDRFLKGMPNGIDKRPPIEIADDPWTGRTVSFQGLPPTRTLTFSFGGVRSLTADGKIVRTTARLRHLETFGDPVVKVTFSTATGYRHLVAVLSAVRPDGSELVISDGGADTSTVSNKPRTISIRLQNEITSIPAGSRLRLTLGARSTVQNIANLIFLHPVAEESRARVQTATIRLPVLKKPVSR